MCVHAQLCPTLCDPMDCSPSGSSVHGISQARILEWVDISSSRGSSQPRDQTHISYISLWLLQQQQKNKDERLKEKTVLRFSMLLLLLLSHFSHVQLFCDPVACSLPGSSVHGISQARILERVAISFSRGSSWPRDQSYIFCIGRQVIYH